MTIERKGKIIEIEVSEKKAEISVHVEAENVVYKVTVSKDKYDKETNKYVADKEKVKFYNKMFTDVLGVADDSDASVESILGLEITIYENTMKDNTFFSLVPYASAGGELNDMKEKCILHDDLPTLKAEFGKKPVTGEIIEAKFSTFEHDGNETPFGLAFIIKLKDGRMLFKRYLFVSYFKNHPQKWLPENNLIAKSWKNLRELFGAEFELTDIEKFVGKKCTFQFSTVGSTTYIDPIEVK